MLTSTMKGDLKEMKTTQKKFLEGLGKSLESMIEKLCLIKGFRKLALGAMSAALAAVAMPAVGKATDCLKPEIGHYQSTGVRQEHSTREFKLDFFADKGVHILKSDSSQNQAFDHNPF